MNTLAARGEWSCITDRREHHLIQFMKSTALSKIDRQKFSTGRQSESDNDYALLVVSFEKAWVAQLLLDFLDDQK